MPRHTLDDIAPGPHLDRTILDVHGDALVELPKNLLGPPLHWRFRLIAILVDVLTEIAFPVQQRHADNRQLEVGRRAQSVTGQHAESAAVRRYRLLEAYLHREVGDAGGQNGRILVDGLAVTGHMGVLCRRNRTTAAEGGTNSVGGLSVRSEGKARNSVHPEAMWRPQLREVPCLARGRQNGT